MWILSTAVHSCHWGCYSFDHSVSFFIYSLALFEKECQIFCHDGTHMSQKSWLFTFSYSYLSCMFEFNNFLSLWLFLTSLSPIFCDRYTRPISQIFRQRVHWFYPADTREIFLKLLKSKVSWPISVILK